MSQSPANALPISKELLNVLSDTGTPPSLEQFLEKEGLLSCALFFECVSNVDDAEAKIAAKLRPGHGTQIRDILSAHMNDVEGTPTATPGDKVKVHINDDDAGAYDVVKVPMTPALPQCKMKAK